MAAVVIEALKLPPKTVELSPPEILEQLVLLLVKSAGQEAGGAELDLSGLERIVAQLAKNGDAPEDTLKGLARVRGAALGARYEFLLAVFAILDKLPESLIARITAMPYVA